TGESMRIGRRNKSEQMALSRNSRNASRNTETPMGSGFYILVPTVPTQNQYLYMRARKIFCSPPNKKIFSIYTWCFAKKSRKVGTNAGNAHGERVLMFRLLFRLFRLCRLASAGSGAR